MVETNLLRVARMSWWPETSESEAGRYFSTLGGCQSRMGVRGGEMGVGQTKEDCLPLRRGGSRRCACPWARPRQRRWAGRRRPSRRGRTSWRCGCGGDRSRNAREKEKDATLRIAVVRPWFGWMDGARSEQTDVEAWLRLLSRRVACKWLAPIKALALLANQVSGLQNFDPKLKTPPSSNHPSSQRSFLIN